MTDDQSTDLVADEELEAQVPAAEPDPDAEDQAGLEPARDIGGTLRRIHSRYLWALLVTYCVAAGIGIGSVLMFAVRDWLLFVGMYLVVFAYMIAYIKAHQRKRRLLRIFGLMTTEVLLGFWIFILVDRIPARKVFVDGQIQVRGEMSWLWGSAVLLILVAIGLVVHWAWVGRLPERAEQAERPPAEPETAAQSPSTL